MKISSSARKRFVNRYLEIGRDIDSACEEFNYTRAVGLWILRHTPEGKEILGQQDIVDEMFACVTEAELGLEYLDALRKMKGEVPVPMVVVDRDGGVQELEVKKYHAADLRGLLGDLAKIAGLMRPVDVNVNLQTVTFDMTGVEEQEAVPDDPVPQLQHDELEEGFNELAKH